MRAPTSRYRTHIRTLASLIALLALGGASTADAASEACLAPPGTAAIEQYCEVAPNVHGNDKQAAPATGKGGGDGNSGAQISLPGGRVLSFEAAATRPPVAKDTPEPEGDGGLGGGIGSAIDSGVGTGFLWLVIGVTVAMSAAGWVRYRQSTST